MLASVVHPFRILATIPELINLFRAETSSAVAFVIMGGYAEL
jgi:hypothetical protein